MDATQTGRYEVELSCRDCYDTPCQWYVRTDHLRRGSLRENESASIPLRLRAGVSYRLMGRCDWDCTELDLRLRGPGRATVAEHVEPGAMSGFDVQPQEGGDFTLVVEMVGCLEEPCKWRVELLSLPE